MKGKPSHMKKRILLFTRVHNHYCSFYLVAVSSASSFPFSFPPICFSLICTSLFAFFFLFIVCFVCTWRTHFQTGFIPVFPMFACTCLNSIRLCWLSCSGYSCSSSLWPWGGQASCFIVFACSTCQTTRTISWCYWFNHWTGTQAKDSKFYSSEGCFRTIAFHSKEPRDAGRIVFFVLSFLFAERNEAGKGSLDPRVFCTEREENRPPS